MRRIASVLLLSTIVVVPSAVGVTEVCANKFDQAWAKKVLSYKEWNRKHPDVVKRRHLDRDMSQQTAALRKRMLKSLDFACPQFWGTSENQDTSYFEAPFYDFNAPFYDFNPEQDQMPILPAYATATIPPEEYPTYDTPTDAVRFDSESAGAGYYGGGGGYFPLAPRKPVEPVTPGTPSTPLSPIPEPLPFSLVAFGAASVIVQLNRSKLSSSQTHKGR